jgi:hypothetical protein
VNVIGNTAFSDTEIAEVTAPFKNRTLMTEDLEQLRLALTLLYINKGYLTSGAITITTNLFLPDANSIANADANPGSGVNGTVTIQSPTPRPAARSSLWEANRCKPRRCSSNLARPWPVDMPVVSSSLGVSSYLPTLEAG